MSNNIIELFVKCNYCKRTIEDGMVYYKHPKFGIVCERCEPFKDGGITLSEEQEND